jgi:hypothetical protein
VIDGTPEVHTPAGDPGDHLVEVPSVARPGPPLAQSSRDRGTEFEHPAPDRFVGQVEPVFGKQFLDIAIAQGEAVSTATFLCSASSRRFNGAGHGHVHPTGWASGKCHLPFSISGRGRYSRTV